MAALRKINIAAPVAAVILRCVVYDSILEEII